MQERFFAAIFLLAAACSRPATTTTPTGTEPGAVPPPITLTSTANAKVALADVTKAHAQTVVVFYRGFF